MSFEDHFSQRSSTYAQYRPRYPAELFAYLAEQTSGHELAWDCATGNGQAALGLVKHYDRVVATDASQEQIDRAVPHERISYRVEPAEQTSLSAASVDLVTAAVDVHWFDFDRFYREVQRVLRPEGLIAVWTYHRPVINPDLDAFIAQLEVEILAGCWPERLHYLQEHYQTLPFPFDEEPAPEFVMEAEWSLDHLVGFFDSWSAVRRYEENHSFHPLRPVWNDFLAAWGSADLRRKIRWPIYLRVGRSHPETGARGE